MSLEISQFVNVFLDIFSCIVAIENRLSFRNRLGNIISKGNVNIKLLCANSNLVKIIEGVN